jgi:hypothetical protein
MKIYLAARYGRKSELIDYAEQLTALGFTVVSRWLTSDRDSLAHEDWIKYAVWDLEDIASVDTVISFTQEPRAAIGTRGGRHVEFGYAHALGKRLIIVGPREHVFHWLPNAEHCESWHEAMALLGFNHPVRSAHRFPC